VEHNVSIVDRRLARVIQRCQELPGYELFQYVDEEGKRQAITSDDVNAHLREITGRDVTAKDFRTWGGTMHAAIALQGMGIAASRREADRNILQALDIVRERLGNTRAVCRKYYVHPSLLNAYLMGQTVPLPPGEAKDFKSRGRGPALRRDEVRRCCSSCRITCPTEIPKRRRSYCGATVVSVPKALNVVLEVVVCRASGLPNRLRSAAMPTGCWR
jgi:DNA topoisomerase IB